MNNRIKPPANISNVHTVDALREGSRPAGSGVSSQLHGCRQFVDQPANPLRASRQNVHLRGCQLVLLESTDRLEKIPYLLAQEERCEWLTQMCLHVAEHGLAHAVHVLQPLTPAMRLLGEWYAGHLSPQTFVRDWQSTWSKLSASATPTELLAAVNQALHDGMSPLLLCYGLGSLHAVALPMIPLHLLSAAVLGYIQEQLIGRLHERVDPPEWESTRFFCELMRLKSNCANFTHYAQPVFDSVVSWVTPSPGERLRIGWDKGTASAEVKTQWFEDQRLLALDRASAGRLEQTLVHVNNRQSGRSESPLTSAGGRLGGPLQGAFNVIGGAFGWLCQQSQPAGRDEDVETPLYPDPGAVYQPTTAPMAPASQHWPAPGAGLGLGAASVALVTGANALYQSITGGPDLIQPASEPVFAQHPPPVQALLDQLKNHWHLTTEGELMSTWDALMTIQAAADARAQRARFIALLHQDFGQSLPRLLDLATPATDADFGEFEALDDPAPVRQRRAAGTDPQAAEVALVEDVIALLDQASSAAQQQDQWLQQEVSRELLSSLPAGHWLHNASAGEQALWLTTTQTLEGRYQRLAHLKYDSLTQFEARRPALQQALAEVNQGELQLAVLKSRLKGDLSPAGSSMDGLAVVMAALNNDPQVAVGSLQLAIGKGVDAVSVTLAQWQVFVRSDARGHEDGVVLYRPAERRVQEFSSQQEMFQHLDLKRMRQSLYAEVQPPATPGPAARRSALPTAPSPKPLPELALEAALPAQRAELRRAFDALGQRADRWTPEHLPFHTYPGASLQDKLEHRAGVLLDSEQARLQRLAANPQLATQEATLALTQQQVANFVDEYLPPLRTFTRRSETRELSKLLQEKGGLAPQVTVDADAVRIIFNGHVMSATDWVLEGYRRHGDNMIAQSNNFLADARFEHDNPAVVQALNNEDVKRYLLGHLRSTYSGDQYINYLQQLRAPNDPRGQTFSQLKTASIQQQLQVTLEQARVDGTIDPYTAGEFKTLVDGLHTVTDTGTASLQALKVNGRRIPEVLVLSLRQRATGQRTAAALRSDYLYLQSPYGPELRKLSDYEQLITTPGAYYDDLQARALLKDKQVVEAIQRGQSDTRVTTAPIANFTRHVSDQWLLDSIDNIREASTSRQEMITEQVVKGLRAAAGVTCMAGSLGIAAVPCGALTLGLMGHDVGSARHHLERGRPDDALMDVAFQALDALEVGQALRALKLGPLLHWAGKPRFSSASELNEAAQAMVRQRDTDFTTLGQLNDALACRDVPREQLTRLSTHPGKADAGIFYELDGKHYIQDRYQDQVQVYEVYSDNAWATVRVRDPQRPNGYGAPVHYRDGHWRVDDGGLLGGGPVASIFKNQGEQAYMGQFRFPDTPDASRIKDQLRRAYRTKSPPPLAAQHYLIQEKEGWRVFGLAGVPPAGPTRELDGVPELQYFDFSSAPPGHILEQWFAYDYRYSYTARHGDGQYPDWTLAYVKPEFMLDRFDPGKLLSTNKEFPSQKAARAYAEEFDILDKELRKTLITRLINGEEIPDLIEQFPVSARLEAKVQQLVNSHDFADEQAVSDCLKNFSFANTIDGEISRMALLSAWLKGGRPPVWASDYLKHPLWERYKNSPAKTASQRQDARSSMTVDAGLYESKSAADEYFKSFPLGYENLNEYVREELAMEMLVNPTSTRAWAFDKATDSSKMILYKSKDIPANLENFKVELGEGCETHLRLPEDMPNLLSIDIRVREGAASETKYTVALPRHAPQLHQLALKNVQFQPSLQLNAQDMPKLKILTITACSETKLIDLGKMSGLQEIDISLNAQLSDLHMPEQFPEATSLRISNNPRLPLGEQHIPRELPELRRLFLENNDLREVSSLIEGLQAPTLRQLDLSGNHLHHLTLPSPGFERLTTVGLAWNDFTTIPQSIMELNPNVDVNLINNRFSDRIQRRYEDAMAAAGYSGPRLRFDEHDDSAVRLARPLSDAVSDWFPPGERVNKKNQWFAHDRKVYAPQFSAWLDKLHRSRSSDIKAFKDQVPAWIKKLETDDDLRQRSFLLADLATTTCDDRVSLIYNQMQELALLSEATKGLFDNNPERLRSELLKLYYFQEIDKYARIHINKAINKNKYIDEVEVHLLMREALSDALNLSVPTSNMLYGAAADFTRADEVAALAYISDSEKQGGFYTYLINIKEVITVLEHKFPQEYKLAKKHLDDLVADPNTGPYAEIRDRMLKETGISLDNKNAMVQIDRAVMAELEKKYYGPLIDQFFKPAS